MAFDVEPIWLLSSAAERSDLRDAAEDAKPVSSLIEAEKDETGGFDYKSLLSNWGYMIDPSYGPLFYR